MAPNEHTRAKDPFRGPEVAPTKNHCFLANETRKLHVSQTMVRRSWPLAAGKVPEPIEASQNLTVVWEVRFFTSKTRALDAPREVPFDARLREEKVSQNRCFWLKTMNLDVLLSVERPNGRGG